MKEERFNWTRRRFISSAAAGLAGAAVVPNLAFSCRETPEKTVRLGFIGLGRQSMYLLNGFIQISGVSVVAGCDVYEVKRKRFEIRVADYYKKTGKNLTAVTCESYTDLLHRDDIDAVVIAVPDHAHAMIAIAACNAGKDVYLEKPLTFTIKEGRELVRAVRGEGRVLAVGSQQRSDFLFRHATTLVRDGALGKISHINAFVGAPPIPYNLPEESVPQGLNWDLWLGPLPASIHFNNELNPPISLNPVEDEKIWGAWRWYREMGGGFTTDWGAHMFDIAQWGLDRDGSGPSEISPIGDGTEYMSFRYPDGVVMTSEPFDEKRTKGVKFWGQKGWIEVSRGSFTASDPVFNPQPSVESGQSQPYETGIPHQVDFIQCVRSRRDPVAPVETGHSSATLCNLGNIACELRRTIKWDPATESFIDDADGAATAKLHYEYRNRR